MKKFKKALGITALSLLGIAVASCDASRNQKVPATSSTIDFSKNYASVTNNDQTYSVTYEQMYNKYRSNGYSTVLTELKKSIIAKELAAATYDNNKELYNKSIISAIFGTDKLDTFRDLHSKEVKDYEDKVDDFITSEYNTYGYVLDNYASQFKELITSLAQVEDLKGSFSWPDELIEQYKYAVALTNLSKAYLETIVDQEKIYSYEDKKKVTNSYYISEDSIKSEYKSAYYKYNKTKAIVVKFKTQAEATKYFNLVNETVGTLTDANAKLWYATLYNLYNKDKKAISVEDPFNDDNVKETVFYTDSENTDLTTAYSSDIATFIYEHLEDGKYLTQPRNVDGSYSLIYRDSVTYYYGNGEGNDFDEIKDITVDNLGNELKDYKGNSVNLEGYIKSKKIESQASQSLGETVVANKLKYNCDIEIYDPIYENQFYNAYSDYYSFTKNFDSSNIFKITYTNDNFTPEDKNDDVVEDTITYSVDAFFNKMDNIYGTEYATTLLEYEYVFTSGLKELYTKDAWNAYEDTAKEAINSFKKNETSYSSKMGLNNYLTLTYGITVSGDAKEELTKYLRQKALVESLSSYYGYFVGGEDVQNAVGSRFVDDNSLFANLAKFSTNTYNQYYDISVNHILISVDPTSNGTHENPYYYLEDLEKVSTTLAQKFKDGVYELAQLIYGELEKITASSKEAMSFLAKSYNNTAYTYILKSDYAQNKGYTTWSDFKEAYSEFNFYLTAEDLGEITSSSSSNYVEEFRDYLKSLAKTIKEDSELQTKITDDEAYLVKEDSYDGLCLTQYGYHILNVYSYTEATSAKFTEDDDTTQGDSQYKKYQHRAITISEKDPDNIKDDLVVYATGYSENDAPSAEQLFIYFYESTKDNGVESMRSSLSSAVKTYFADVMSRYKGSSFQAYRLLQQTMGFASYDAENKTFTSITFYDVNGNASDEKATKFQKYVKKLRIACDSGDELEEDNIFYGWFDLDWTSDLTKCSYFHYDD